VRGRGWRGARGCALWLVLAAAPWPALAFDDAALAKQTYEKIILPGYTRFDDAARAFAESAQALCHAPSAAALAATRSAAKDALLAFGRIEPLRFGPITEKQRLDRLLFYPDAHGLVGKQTGKLLAKRDDADIEPEKLPGASVAVQGFGAVDAALYGNGADALATRDPATSFRCRYIRALALDIAEIAAETRAAWAGDYKRAWLEPGGADKTYLSAKETTQALYRAYVTQLEVIRVQRLAPLFGEAKGGAATTPLLAHSGLGLPFILANIEGTRALLGEEGFLAADLAHDDKERAAIAVLGSVATDLGFAVRAGAAAMAMAADPLADRAARERLAPMLPALKNAEDTGRPALGELTGQSLGFNSLDGD
jgi:predicted lipoprotein